MPLAVRAGRLIDGTGAPPRRNVLMLIEKNRIRACGRGITSSAGHVDPRKYLSPRT